jgi:thiol:disulfide interchange protein DsbC
MLKRIVSKIPFLAFLLLSCVLLSTPSFCFEKKGQDCSKCHTLSSDGARDLLKGAIPDVRIIQVKLSPVQGLWEIYLESRGRKGLIYVDFAKKHFFTGSLISIGERKNLTQERFTELNRIDVSQIPLENALVLGDPKAKTKVICFSDPD